MSLPALLSSAHNEFIIIYKRMFTWKCLKFDEWTKLIYKRKIIDNAPTVFGQICADFAAGALTINGSRRKASRNRFIDRLNNVLRPSKLSRFFNSDKFSSLIAWRFDCSLITSFRNSLKEATSVKKPFPSIGTRWNVRVTILDLIKLKAYDGQNKHPTRQSLHTQTLPCN